MPALSERRWTRAEVLALPADGKRYELVDGELLVSPTPRVPHQVAVQGLFLLLNDYVTSHRLGLTFCVPGDLSLGGGQVIQPDLYVLPGTLKELPEDWGKVGVPLLVVEVLSPSTARYDRVVKRGAYQRAGVATYWIVDLDAQLVEVWTPAATSPIIVTETLVWQPDPDVPPLAIGLDAIFRSN